MEYSEGETEALTPHSARSVSRVDSFAGKQADTLQWLEETLLFKGTNGGGTNFHLHFPTVNGQSFNLKIGFPDLFGMALRKTDITAVLLALTGDFTFLHKFKLP